MKAKRFLTAIKFFRFGFFLSWISMFAIVTGPLALAEQTKNQQKEAINMFMKESGLADNKNMTMGEVWKRIRKNFPAEMQAKLDLPFAIYKDEKFPQIDFSELKDSKGNNVMAMNVSDGGDTARVEILGQKDIFMKFNGKAISTNELRDLNAFANKVKDEKIVKKDEEKYKKALLSQPIVPTYEQWKSMSPYERAHFLVLFRLMVRETQEVLALHEAANPTSKSSQLEKEVEVYLKLLTGENAFAEESPNEIALKRNKASDQRRREKDIQDAKKIIQAEAITAKESSKQSKPGLPAGKSKSAPPWDEPRRNIATGESCIFGGYPAGEVTKKGICTLRDPKQFANGCSPYKGKPQISCNPVLYGYNRTAGGPLCFSYDINNPETQVATSKFCEDNSKLRPGNAQDSYEMIQSILKEKGMKKDDVFQDLFKISTDKNGKEIVAVEKAAYENYMSGPDGILEKFKIEKNKAIEVCSKIKDEPDRYERKETRQQTKACDALTKRMVSVGEAMASVQQGITAGPATVPVPPCPPTAPIPTPVDAAAGDIKVDTNVTPIVTGPVHGPPAPVVVKAGPTETCLAPVAGGGAVENRCANYGDCPNVTVSQGEEEKKKDTGGGFVLPTWAKTSLVIGAIAGFLALSVWGLSKLFKRKKTEYIAPATSVNGGVATPITTPVTPAPITPEGGSGASPASGNPSSISPRKAGK